MGTFHCGKLFRRFSWRNQQATFRSIRFHGWLITSVWKTHSSRGSTLNMFCCYVLIIWLLKSNNFEKGIASNSRCNLVGFLCNNWTMQPSGTSRSVTCYCNLRELSRKDIRTRPLETASMASYRAENNHRWRKKKVENKSWTLSYKLTTVLSEWPLTRQWVDSWLNFRTPFYKSNKELSGGKLRTEIMNDDEITLPYTLLLAKFVGIQSNFVRSLQEISLKDRCLDVD